MSNYFEELASVNCSENVEKKNGFSYLSWPFAVGELLKRHPDANWRVYETPDGFPYFTTPSGCFVKVGVTVGGVERIQWHPVLDHRNKTVKDPDAFQINTSIQRGLVKAIALHGLGLYIYAGEDLPEGVEHAPITPHGDVFESMGQDEQEFLRGIAAHVSELISAGEVDQALSYIHSQKLDVDEKVALNTLFDSKERATMKKFLQEQKEQKK